LKRIITLTTDFGAEDHYVGSMKGVILGINRNSVIVDITHNINNHNIFNAALNAQNFYKYFPNNSIHVVVVDPGVGSLRKPIAVQSEHGIFIGPDNGVFSLILEQDQKASVYEITNSEYMLDNVSNTFHGRDIFAPAAAHISLGIDIASIGMKVDSPIILNITKPVVNDDEIVGEVVYTDHFGNLTTNIPSNIIGNPREIHLDGYIIDTVAKSYQDVEIGKLLAIIGSSGFLEISVNQGRAADVIKSRKIIVKK